MSCCEKPSSPKGHVAEAGNFRGVSLLPYSVVPSYLLFKAPFLHGAAGVSLHFVPDAFILWPRLGDFSGEPSYDRERVSGAIPSTKEAAVVRTRLPTTKNTHLHFLAPFPPTNKCIVRT